MFLSQKVESEFKDSQTCVASYHRKVLEIQKHRWVPANRPAQSRCKPPCLGEWSWCRVCQWTGREDRTRKACSSFCQSSKALWSFRNSVACRTCIFPRLKNSHLMLEQMFLRLKRKWLTNVVVLFSSSFHWFLDQFLYHERFLIFKLLIDFRFDSIRHIDNCFFKITCFWLKSWYNFISSMISTTTFRRYAANTNIAGNNCISELDREAIAQIVWVFHWKDRGSEKKWNVGEESAPCFVAFDESPVYVTLLRTRVGTRK